MNAFRYAVRLVRRAWEGFIHYRLTVVTTVLIVAVVVLFQRSEDTQQGLVNEARARTTESCHETQRSRDGTIRLWSDLIAFLTPKDPAAAERSRPSLDGIEAIVAAAYPPVICAQDQGPIVIPSPVTSTP